MLFNSFHFLIFLPIVFFLYWFVASKKLKFQNFLLLVASFYFYACWDWRFLFLLAFSIFLDYFTGLMIDRAEDKRARKLWLLTSIFVNLGFLAFFKYFNFFIDSFRLLLTEVGIQTTVQTLDIILPIGISFYTFHGLSYVIDIYYRKITSEKNFMEYAVFVAFFPLLVAGPIERATHLLPQIKKERAFDKVLFKEGILQIAVGFFRKIVVADTLAKYVDVIYANPEMHNSTTLIIANVFYAFQIYCDFAGYSDIAIGTAKLFGFKLLQNFNLPYFSRTITEFWRRWHMSLSFWLRDYLYIELGGNRKGIVKTYRNLLLTMLLGGLWHGANWTFIIWGGIHGVILCIEKVIMTQKKLSDFLSKLKFLGFFYTFSVVTLAWVFFRSSSTHQALAILTNILSFDFGRPFVGDVSIIVNICFALLISFSIDVFLFRRQVFLEHLGSVLNFKITILLISVFIVLICLFYSTSNNFIYFQF